MLHEPECPCEACRAAKALQPRMTPDEAALFDGILSLQKRQAAEVVGLLEAFDDSPDEHADPATLVFDVGEWSEIYASELSVVIEPLLMDGWDRGERKLQEAGAKGFKAEPSAGAWAVFNPEVLTWAQTYPREFGERVNKNFANQITRDVAKGLSEGKTGRQIAAGLREGPLGSQMTAYRADTIARTESVRAREAGEVESWKNSGAVSGKRWAAMQDHCPFCDEMDGKLVDLNESFFAMGQELSVEGAGNMKFTYEDVGHPPLHPRCRCTLLAELIEFTIADQVISIAVDEIESEAAAAVVAGGAATGAAGEPVP